MMIFINEYINTLIFAKRYEIMNESLEIKESEKKQYLILYDEFAKFVNNPNKLTGNLWSGIIADICKIINMSSEKLNQLVANNIKSIGQINKFDEKDEFQAILKNKLGECYILEKIADAEYLYYSITNKKLYYVDHEHEEYTIFYHDFPYDTREFGDFIYGDKDINIIRSLFKEHDKNNNYNLFQ